PLHDALPISEVAWPEIVFSVVAFTGLTLVGVRIGSRWAAPIGSGDPAAPEVRRRALMFPWAMAAVVFGGWVMAGVVWGVVWPLLAGTFTLPSAVRAGIGITAVGGVVTATIVFFSIANRWRHELPQLFPAGDLSSVRGVPRLPVRARLLVVFLLKIGRAHV